jgi:hypothetical protein
VRIGLGAARDREQLERALHVLVDTLAGSPVSGPSVV